MTTTASYDKPPLAGDVKLLCRYVRGVQKHLLSLWSTDSGSVVATVELTTYKGEVIDMRIIEGEPTLF